MDFDNDEMLEMVLRCHPKQVNIGKNTNPNVALPEPDAYKVLKLAKALHNKGVKVKFKTNILWYLKDAVEALKKGGAK